MPRAQAARRRLRNPQKRAEAHVRPPAGALRPERLPGRPNTERRRTCRTRDRRRPGRDNASRRARRRRACRRARRWPDPSVIPVPAARTPRRCVVASGRPGAGRRASAGGRGVPARAERRSHPGVGRNQAADRTPTEPTVRLLESAGARARPPPAACCRRSCRNGGSPAGRRGTACRPRWARPPAENAIRTAGRRYCPGDSRSRSSDSAWSGEVDNAFTIGVKHETKPGTPLGNRQRPRARGANQRMPTWSERTQSR